MKRPFLKISFRCLVVLAMIVLFGVAWNVIRLYYFDDFDISNSDDLTYTGSDACMDCHQEATHLWRESDHAHAMALATSENVAGDFDNATLTHFDVTSRMFRDSDHFYIETDNSDGILQTFEILYVLGRQPLQQYLVKFPDGRIQCLPIAWNTRDRKWFHLYPDDPVPPSDPIHWTKTSQTWNTMCADCHTTNYQMRYQLAAADNAKSSTKGCYDSQWNEMGVGCETCHGPGSAHCERATSWWGIPAKNPNYGLIDLKKDKPDSQVNICAPCHARRHQIAADVHVTKKFADKYNVELLDQTAYYPDGQVCSEDFEYTSFIQCRMYHEKVKCTDCHDPHSMRVKFDDNRLCTQCHLTEKYDNEKHHFHQKNPALSSNHEMRLRTAERADGTYCTDCHMPASFFMICDARPDHSIRVPRPDLTESLGVPNACNNCHFDQKKGETPRWADENCAKWYGKSWADRKKIPHFAEVFSDARQGNPNGEMQLVTLLARADLRPVIRASALRLLANYQGRAGSRAALDALNHSNVWVRLAAVQSLEVYIPTRIELCSSDANVQSAAKDAFIPIENALKPMLHDESLAIRHETARILALADASDWATDDRNAFMTALVSYQNTQKTMENQPASHFALAVLASQRNDLIEAEREYRLAIEMDPYFFQARANLVALYDEKKDAEKAEPLLHETLTTMQQRLQQSDSWINVAADDANLLPVGGEGRFFSQQLANANKIMDTVIASNTIDSTDAIGKTHEKITTNNDVNIDTADKECRRASNGLFPYAWSQPTQATAAEQVRRQLQTQVAESHYALGLFLANAEKHGKKRTDEALPYLENAVQMLPNDSRKRYNLALCLHLLGRQTEALSHIEMLLSTDPTNPTYRQLRQLIQTAIVSTPKSSE